jgi:protein-tyrosine-phosphatase
MAEGLMKHYFGNRVYVDSVGVRPAEIDPFAVGVMDEVGIDISRHKPKSFDQLEDSSFDVVVSLSPEAQHSAVEMTRTMACELEFWHTFDATFVQGRREQVVASYQQVRDFLQAKILERFGSPTVGSPD